MKKLIKPLLLLVLLLAIWTVIHQSTDRPDHPAGEDVFAVSIDTASVTRVQIHRGGDSLSLTRDSGNWMVQTATGTKPADQAQVISALTSLSQISTSNLVSHNPEKQGEFNVTESAGTRVRVYGPGDSPSADLVIGRIGGFNQQEIYSQRGINPQDFYTFMRHAGSDRVFKVQGFFGGFLGTEAEQWRDHNLMSFAPEEALRLELEFPEEKVALARDTSGVWRLVEPRQAETDPEVVRQMLATLGAMRANGFADDAPEDSLGLAAPRLTVRVQLENGASFGLEVGAELPDNLFYCRIPGQPQVYTLARYRLDQVMKRPDELLKKEQPTGEQPRSRPAI